MSIFNSMIAACAHGGEYNKARLMFERMAEHGCQADAVTYANLIRAYKKGGQWCHALDTFEAMQRSGCRPHAAVYSSIIDVLWQTGIAWAQAKALRLFTAAVEYALAPFLSWQNSVRIPGRIHKQGFGRGLLWMGYLIARP